MDTNKAPHHRDELKQHEVPQVINFLKHYGKMIGTGVLAATVMVVASNAIRAQKAGKQAEAEAMLLAARSPQQLEDVVAKYSSTPAAPIALLDLAKTSFNSGNYFQARAQYEQFLKNYKNHELSPIATCGLANCSEADGDFDGAIAQFTAFIQTQKGHYLQPLAVVGLARSLEQAGRADEARIVLEDFLAENAGSQWAGLAENSLQLMTK